MAPNALSHLDRFILQPKKQGVAFRCPLCRHVVFNDAAGLEPMCTGPRWTDDHEPTVMVRS
jgi:hypothetical protein